MRVRLAFLSPLFTLCLFAGQSHAAPQMLGVVATAEPVPMSCQDGTCTAELSAFCLQQGRSGPQDGTSYTAVSDDGLQIIAFGDDGAARILPVNKTVSFKSARSYSAVTISIPAERVKSPGVDHLAVSTGSHLTLAPVPVVGDPQPLSEQEIAQTSTSLRAIADDLFSGSAKFQIATAEALNRLINALPAAAGAETIDLTAPDGIWAKAIGGTPRVDDPNPGVAQAALAYQSCRRGAHFVQGFTIRRCLEASHDALMSSLNTKYWAIAGAGS